MLKAVKEAFVKYDLYSVKIADHMVKAFPLEKAPGLDYYLVVKKGTRVCYCQTDRKDAAMGWYYENIGMQGHFDTRCEFAPKHCTEPKELLGGKFR
jgi:hypothetical protein